MKLEDYTYNLPDELIAAHPPEVRGGSRLLALNRATGEIADSFYRNVADFFEKGDVLVLNDTKVIKARLFVEKASGAPRELVVLERHGGDDDWRTHKVMYRGKISKGDVLTVSKKSGLGEVFENSSPKSEVQAQAETGAREAEALAQQFSQHEPKISIKVEEILGDGLAIVSCDTDLRELCEQFGTVPLPPYMRRDATPLDIERYQTVFAEEKGSVAAPTASLNMTDEILESLRKKGVSICYLTLHVGLGTFLPIRVDNLEEHKMHQEYFEIPSQTAAEIRKAKENGGRIFALGTTVARTLEYATNAIFETSLAGNSGRDSGEKFEFGSPKSEVQAQAVTGEQKSQHFDKESQPSQITKTANGDLKGEADIFIYPGYEFRTIDGLITNFHAPKSTVLMLASAFGGWQNISKAYSHAAEQKYRFLSYGDSMIIFSKK